MNVEYCQTGNSKRFIIEVLMANLMDIKRLDNFYFENTFHRHGVVLTAPAFMVQTQFWFR